MSDEKIDHAALIENARQGAADIREHEYESHHWSADLIDRLRVALEAAQQAPKNLSTESWGAGTVLGSAQPSGAANAHLRDPQALLSRVAPEAQQAPAVDREALVKFLRENENYTHDPDADGWVFSAEMAATGLFASGILQDAAEVEARGLEKAAMLCDDKWGEFAYIDSQGVIGYATVPEILNEAAQQVREGN